MGVLQHDGPGMEVWVPGNFSTVDEAAVIVINQVKVVAFARIIPQTEIADKIIFRVHILYQEIGREPGAEHDLPPQVDGMDVQLVNAFTVRKG